MCSKKKSTEMQRPIANATVSSSVASKALEAVSQIPQAVRKKKKPQVSPEYIAEQRVLRELRKKAKREAEAAVQKSASDNEEDDDQSIFIKRPLLDIPNVEPYVNGKTLKIMSYNVSKVIDYLLEVLVFAYLDFV